MHDTAAAGRVRFGPFALDLRSGELFKGATRLKVPNQSIEILTALVDRPGQLVTRDELRQRLWPGNTFVDFEHGLNAAVRRLRQALGDAAGTPRFIETLPRRGYRFVGRVDVTAHLPSASHQGHTDAASPPDSHPPTWRSSRPRSGWPIGALLVLLAIVPLVVSTHWTPTSDRRVWTKRYDRSLDDSLAMPGDVALGIAADVSAAVAAEGRAPLTPHASVAPDAFDAYLRGMSFRRRWQEGGCSSAVTELERAVAHDPTLADAHAALAWCYAFPARTGLPAAVAGPKARQEAKAALALNPGLGLARAALGEVKHRLDYDWAGAEREFTLAVDLNPDDPDARFTFGEFLYAAGKSREGIARLRSALLADPSNADRNTALGVALVLVRQYDAAIRQLHNTLAMNPEWTTARRVLSYAYEAQGDRDRAIAEYLAWLEHVLVPSRAPGTVAQLKHIYDKSGWHGFWQHELELVTSERHGPGTLWQPRFARYAGPYHMALRYARLGKRDRALSFLQQAHEQRHHMMVFLKLEPVLDVLHDDPAFQALTRQVGIP